MFFLPLTQIGRQDTCESLTITFSRKTANTDLPKTGLAALVLYLALTPSLLTEPNK